MTNSHATTRRRAFTLVELVAAMVVVAVIGTVGAMTLQRAAAANSQVALRGSLTGEASATLDRIVRFMQSSPAREASNPAVPSIASLSATSITFDSASTLVYNANSQTITLRDVAAGDATNSTPLLQSNVSAFSMTPFNESNADLFAALGVSTLNSTQAQAVRRVSVSITLTRQGQSVTLRARAFLRCTMVRAVDQ